MKKTTTGIIAGVAGIALLVGGATFALWEDKATSNHQYTIGAGAFDIVSQGDIWQDVSPDVADNPREFDPETFRMVPGDDIRLTSTFDVRMRGDNLQADLIVTAPWVRSWLVDGVTATYTVMENGAVIVPPTALGTNTTTTIHDIRMVDGEWYYNGRYTVIIDLSLDEATPDQLHTTMFGQLGQITVELKQTRPTS